MLYVITGGTSQERAEMRRKRVKGALEELDPLAISALELASMAGTLTLTGENRSFFLRGALLTASEENEDTAERRDALLEIMEGLSESPHIFIFEEEKVTAKILTQLTKSGAHVDELKRPEKKEAFNIFEISAALARADRKGLWLLLTKALRDGIAPENVAGVLAWKARTMLAAAQTPLERKKLERVSRELVVMYHDSHRGAGDLGLLLERFALTL
ncbi:MAG: hypothetical protein KGJ34_01435 [Patescibacteria group bacterium]|nr:hypothetical protein [Patescibacteria group bacterium]